MAEKSNGIIIKFEFCNEQTVGEVTKIVGLIGGRFIVPIIDNLNLEANPRSSKVGAVTDAIQESLANDPLLFPFKSKGILLASSRYERMERNRIRIMPDNLSIEGILDGGHNTLAIGLFILEKALEFKGMSVPKGVNTWNLFKQEWEKYHNTINDYLEVIRKNPEKSDLNFLIPAELLVPSDVNDFACVTKFKNDLFDICAARNNNAELPLSTKNNQKGFYDTLKYYMELQNPAIASRIEWKANEGGDIKAQDIVALSWIPLSLINPVKDQKGRVIDPVAASALYRSKGSCLKQFEKLMSSQDVTLESDENYKHELLNVEVGSALKIAAELPELYDYIFEVFPSFYNKAGGSYGRITAVKKLNEKRAVKKAPFSGKEVETLSPEGFIVPLVYGLQALLERKVIEGRQQIVWSQSPMPFLMKHLPKIIEDYSGILSLCDYDPQKVGKAQQSYTQILTGYKMALAGIL